MTIKLLDEETINQIAAGEVVESPHAVVKELIENSIDSGANSLRVEIKEGGFSLIRVSDNGKGMSPNELNLSILRHATSKIKKAEDLQSIGTMGFRGEALASIAAVSELKLISAAEGEVPSEIISKGGETEDVKPMSRSMGTTVQVRRLFYNVPARRSFQKSASKSTQDITKLMTQVAFSHTKTALSFISGEKELFSFPAHSSFFDGLESRAKALLGEVSLEGATPIDTRQGSWSLKGLLFNEKFHKPNRLGQYLFINQRIVFHPLLSSAVQKGYGTRIPTGRVPQFILFLEVDPKEVEVNVHPQKREVRLRETSSICSWVTISVNQALMGVQSPNLSTLPWISEIKVEGEISQKERGEVAPVYHSVSYKKELFSDDTYLFSNPEKEEEALQLPLNPAPDVALYWKDWAFFEFESLKIHHKLSQISRNEEEAYTGWLLMHVRRAKSRVFYQCLIKEDHRGESQRLLIPIELEFSQDQIQALMSKVEDFEKMGFELQQLGKCELLVQAIPNEFQEKEVDPFFSEMIQEVSGDEVKFREQMCIEAAKASERSLTRIERSALGPLFLELMDSEESLYSLSAKPIFAQWSQMEIEKRFKG